MEDESFIKTPITYNRTHKRLMVLYDMEDMRKVWAKVRRDYKKEFKIILPKRFSKHLDLWNDVNNWIETKISKFVENGGIDIEFYNKSDLKERGWDDKIIQLLYPKPDKVVYLGRGRYAYYYNGASLMELEDSEEFLEYITIKLERKRKRKASKDAKEHKIKTGFGNEFIQ